MTIPHPILFPNRKQRTLKDTAYFQECLSEQVDMFLEELIRREDDPEDEAFNLRVHTLLRDWRAGQGAFAGEVGKHIEAICEAVKGALK